MTEQTNVINIDGKEYKQEDLSVEQIRLVTKVAKFQKQTNDLKDAFEDANILHQQYLQLDHYLSLQQVDRLNNHYIHH